MGWARCGKDSKGREIGYGVIAKCDHPGCKRRIDRGLEYACGGEHGSASGCEKYFCGHHLYHPRVEEDHPMMCRPCCERVEKEAKENTNADEEDEFEELDQIQSEIPKSELEISPEEISEMRAEEAALNEFKKDAGY